MKMKFENKVVVLTGGVKGIGNIGVQGVQTR